VGDQVPQELSRGKTVDGRREQTTPREKSENEKEVRTGVSGRLVLRNVGEKKRAAGIFRRAKQKLCLCLLGSNTPWMLSTFRADGDAAQNGGTISAGLVECRVICRCLGRITGKYQSMMTIRSTVLSLKRRYISLQRFYFSVM
jgi:hypothetical protein